MFPFRLLLVPMLALICLAAVAEDLPGSSGCRSALKALDEAEDALAASAASREGTASDKQRQQAAAARLQPLRQRVADACLGGLTTSPSPSQHTWVAPSPPANAPLALPRVPQPALPPVTVPLQRPDPLVTVTHCTAAVCFGSDGSTMTRVGPGLVGPRGQCTVQGGFVRCP